MIQLASFWLLLLVAVPVHWMLPERWRGPFLAVTGVAFLGYHYPNSVGGMALVGTVVFLLTSYSNRTGRRKGPFWASLVAILAYLGYFKYFAQIADTVGMTGVGSIVLPIGISYFSFKLLHFVIEVKRGRFTDVSVSDYTVFLALVPIFTAGPITRFDGMKREPRLTQDLVTDGVTRIAYGMVKQFVAVAIVSSLLLRARYGQPDVTFMLDHLGTVPAARVWAFLIFTFGVVYLGFSAYSDIAIGASRLFGYRIAENFNFPFLAPNIGNFWKRWHISLSTWCQTYIYLPVIGLTRSPYAAAFASFTVMGLWHAASWNFLLWGWYNALGVVVFQAWSQFKRRRKLKIAETGLLSYGKYVLTFLFFSGSFAFSSTHGVASAYDAIRLLARAFFVTLPG